MDEYGRPVFVNRIALDVIFPTGKYDTHTDLNQSSHFYSLNPSWASTLLPASRWELSWRIYYLYNFKNRDPASGSPQIFVGWLVRDTQASQAAWANASIFYEVIHKISVGINAYFFKQFDDDKVNSQRLTGSREKVLGVGAGVFWRINAERGLWFNIYQEEIAENRAKNDFFNAIALCTCFLNGERA